MQSLKKIMEEMGFNKDAPVETQKAFIKHLISAANQTRPTSVVPRVHQNSPTKSSSASAETKTVVPATGTQLEFDLSDNNKRVS